MLKFKITIWVNYDHPSYRLLGIKAIRTFTGLGLKEAKDIHDTLIEGGTPLIINANQLAVMALERELMTRAEYPLIIQHIERHEELSILDVSANQPC